MGKASISINIGALWNGESAIKQTNTSLNTLTQAAKQSSDALASSAAIAGEKWVNVGYRVQSIGDSITAFGDTLTQHITEPATALGGYCVDQAKTYDTALANLNKTANLTADELQAFGDAAIEASKTSPVTSDDILNAEALGAQLGISSENLREFADVATGLDISTNMGLEEAATELARFLNIMGESDDAADNYGSTIVDLGNNFATTESEIANMSERLAGASANTKLTSSEVMGMAAAMSSLGIKAEAGGSSMTTILNNISAAVNSSSDTVEEYAKTCGISAEEFANKWKSSPIEALELMISKAHEMVENGGNLTETLNNWGVSGIRQTDVMSRLINNGDILTEAVNQANTAWEQNTALTTEVEKRNESIESRFQTLQNQVDATATKVGVNLANSLLDTAENFTPLLENVDDLVDWFNSLDTSTQGAITTMGLVAVAAGPVISASGKLVSGMGKVTTKFGEAKEQFAITRAALNETDGSLLRTYASSNKLSSTIGLAGNEALKAAGGVDNYVASWEKMESSAKTITDTKEKIAELTQKGVELAEEFGKGSKKVLANQQAIGQLNSELEDAQVAFQSSANQITEWTGSTAEMEAALDRADSSVEQFVSGLDGVDISLVTSTDSTKKAGNLFSGLGKTALTAGKDLVKSFAVSGLVGLAIAGLGLIVTKIGEAVAKQEQLSKASQTAGDIMGSAASKADEYGSAIGEMDIDIDSTTQKLVDLNESLSNLATEFYTNSAKVEEYQSIMNELGNKSSLTASEQWKLQQAVDGYNEIVGTAYQLTDDYKIALEDENGNLQVSTDTINANTEAWKAKAEAEAYAAKAQEYLEAEVEAEMKLKQAQSERLQVQQEMKDVENDQTMSWAERSSKLLDLQTRESELNNIIKESEQDVKSAADSYDYLSQKGELAASSLSSGLTAALQNLPSTALESATAMSSNFQAGIAAGAITEEQALSFTSALNTQLSLLPTDAQSSAAQAAANIAQSLSDGSIGVGEAVTQVKGIVDAKLREIESNAAVEGSAAVSSYASNLGAGTGQVTTSANNISAAAKKMGDGDFKNVGSTVSGSYNSGFISNQRNVESTAAKIASASKKMGEGDSYQWGSHLGSNFNSGLGSWVDGIARTASNLMSAARRAMGFSVPKAGPWSGKEKGGYTSGQHLAQNFARGMTSGIPAIASAANSAMAAIDLTNSSLNNAMTYSGNRTALAATGAANGTNIYINGVNVNDYADMVSATRDYLMELNRIGNI